MCEPDCRTRARLQHYKQPAAKAEALLRPRSNPVQMQVEENKAQDNDCGVCQAAIASLKRPIQHRINKEGTTVYHPCLSMSEVVIIGRQILL
jgi:hypothetical protein